MLDKKELEKLPLKERIEKLKELEKERQKDIDEAKKLQEQFQEELRTEEVLDNVEIPEPEPVDISKLFISEDGIEANVRVEQERYRDFNTHYVNIADNLGDPGGNQLYHNQTLEIPVEKIDKIINPEYSANKDAAEKTTASAGIAEEIRKYSAG